MTSMPPPPELLSHATFVRRLAGALLRGDADADDAAQEAIVRSIERPAGRASEGRGWIAAIVRNVVRRRHRDGVRLRAREAVAARPEAVDSAEQLAARDEIVRRVGAAVAALDEPSRAVVLLRHYEGLAPRDIAARLGVPVETVKTRLKRAYEKLRASLDERRGGNVEGWRVALAALVGVGVGGRSTASAGVVGKSTGGGLAMGTGVRVGIGALLAAVLCLGAWRISVRSTEDGPGAELTPSAVLNGNAPLPALVANSSELASDPIALASKPTPIVDSDLPPGWKRQQVGTMSVALPEEWKVRSGNPLSGGMTWLLSGTDGRPKAFFRVMPAEATATYRDNMKVTSTRKLNVLGVSATWSEGTSNDRLKLLVASDSKEGGIGGYFFDARTWESSWGAYTEIVERALGSLKIVPAMPSSLGLLAGMPSPTDTAAWNTPIPGDRVEGAVLVDSRPVAGASVRLAYANQGAGLAFLEISDLARSVVTNEDGLFVWSGVGPSSWSIDVDAPGLGHRRMVVHTQAASERSNRVLIEFGGAEITGRSYLRTGKPAVALRVSALCETSTGVWADATTDADGVFRITGLCAGSYMLDGVCGPGVSERPDTHWESVRLSANERKEIDLGTSKADPEWTGVMRLSTGTLIEDPLVGIWLRRTSPMPELGLSTQSTVGGRIRRRLPTGTYGVKIWIPGRHAATETELVIGDSDLQHDFTIPGVRLAGTLRDAETGKPFPLAKRPFMPTIQLVLPDGRVEPAMGLEPDERGAFHFDAIPPGAYRLSVQPPYTPEPPYKLRESDTPPVEVTIGADRDVTGLVIDLRLK